MSTADRLTLVATILAVPWTILAGLMWWNPVRRCGSSPWLRYAVYAAPAVLTCLAVLGAIR